LIGSRDNECIEKAFPDEGEGRTMSPLWRSSLKRNFLVGSVLASALFLVGCPKPLQPTNQPIQTPIAKKSSLPDELAPPAAWYDLGPKTAAPAATEAVLDKGRDLYLEKCAVCHGDSGGGDGPYANQTPFLPRDFRQGIFKIRSTPTGSLPTDADLFRTITRGVPGGGMPGMLELSEEERWALVRYTQELTVADEADERREPIFIPEPTAQDAAAAARGRAVYLLLDCRNCHGIKGDATGLRSKDLLDDWGKPIRVTNLTQPWPYKGGSTPRDLYRTLVAGLDGSPMPPYDTNTRFLFSKKDFTANWQDAFSRELSKDALAEIKTFIDTLPESTPKSEADKKKMAEGYRYDLIAYIRANFPRKVKE
jgi:mono/diheme cytochrome c family protein